MSWLDEYKTLVLDRVDSQGLKQQLENKIDINYIKFVFVLF
jgi:hypothetical protein